jgi:hypothetical protein
VARRVKIEDGLLGGAPGAAASQPMENVMATAVARASEERKLTGMSGAIMIVSSVGL